MASLGISVGALALALSNGIGPRALGISVASAFRIVLVSARNSAGIVLDLAHLVGETCVRSSGDRALHSTLAAQAVPLATSVAFATGLVTVRSLTAGGAPDVIDPLAEG